MFRPHLICEPHKMMTSTAFTKLQSEIRACTLCHTQLPLGPRPVLQISRAARILIAGQAPGSKVHASGIPFDDASGDRLRDWLGMDRETFYDASRVAILPMGFCVIPARANPATCRRDPNAPWHGARKSCANLPL